MIEFEIYVDPISKDNSVGDNIEYNHNYLKLLDTLQDKPEQQFGEIVIEAKKINWEEVYSLSSDILLDESKDLNVMSYFSLSAIYCYGVSGLYGGLKVIHENLKLYWDDLYPSLYDEDNIIDLDYRINSLSIFNASDGIIKALKSTVFVKNKLTNQLFSFKDIEKILENPTDAYNIYQGGIERLYVDLKMAEVDENSEISLLTKSVCILKEIDNFFEIKTGKSELRFNNLIEFVNKFLILLKNYDRIEDSKEILINKPFSDKNINEFNWNNFEIKSRNDIELLLEKIYLYFEKNEPSHPAPLFIRRIQRLMTYNFYEIMKDISPESMDKLINLVGQPIDNNTTE